MRVLPQTLGTALPHKHRRIIPPKEPITPALCQRSRTVLRRSPAYIPRRGWNDRAVSANSLQRVGRAVVTCPPARAAPATSSIPSYLQRSNGLPGAFSV